jgi:phosphate transport system substrate-binding protein
MKLNKLAAWMGIAALSISLMAGCGGKTEQAQSKLSGAVKIDGSSTVFPISEAVAEEFQKKNPEVKVTVGESGTTGGMKKFVPGEIDIADASRPIKKEEAEGVKARGDEVIEIPVAYDGLTVVIHKDNTWAKTMTVEELKKIWEPNSTVKNWSDVRADWPNEPIKLYGPGTASGTFEYFTEAIVGKAKSSRADYTASEDDNVLVKGVAGDKNSLGYFGYVYFLSNKDKMQAVAITNKEGQTVSPTEATIKDGSYKPLSRPIFIYVSKKALERPEVKEFVKFYITNATKLVPQVGYVPYVDAHYQEMLKKVQ